MKNTKTILGLGIVLLLAGFVLAAQPTTCQQGQTLIGDRCVGTPATQQDNCGFWARLVGRCTERGPNVLGADCGTVTPGTNDECCKNKNPNFVWDQVSFRCVNSQAYNQENCGYWGRLTGACGGTSDLGATTTTTMPGQCQTNQVYVNGKCVGTPATEQENCGFWARFLGRC